MASRISLTLTPLIGAAIGSYDVTRAFGGSPKDARRAGAIAGVSQWALSPSGGKPAPTFGEAALMGAFNVIAASDPKLGQALMFISGNWGKELGDVAQNAVGQALQYQSSRALARWAAKRGYTLQELNLALALNSKIGLAFAGTTYDNDRHRVGGFLTRVEHKYLGVIWDINDTLLNAQGLLDAISLSIVDSGYNGPLIGHSLGAARVNNLFRQGYISQAITLSLPGFAYPVAGSESVCGNLDLICGGALMSILRPGTERVDSPSWLNWVGSNHTIHTVDGYKEPWNAWNKEP